jgi:hypothetical protein
MAQDIKLQVSVNAGAPQQGQQGGVEIDYDDTLAFSLSSTSGVRTARFRIVEYPEGFVEPAGWQTDATEGYYYCVTRNGAAPPTVTAPSSPLWGDFLCDVQVTLGGGVTQQDDSLGLTLPSPNGVPDFPYKEGRQFDRQRSWSRKLKDLARAVSSGVSASLPPIDDMRVFANASGSSAPPVEVNPQTLVWTEGSTTKRGVAPYATVALAKAGLAGTVVANRIYETAGKNSANDGGGGTWIGVTGASVGTYPESGRGDGGLHITPAGGNGSAALVRQRSGHIDVRWFGAIGDNSTDCTAAFQAAIDAASDRTVASNRPGTTEVVYVPNGTFKLLTPVHLRAGVRLVGAGPASKLSEKTGWSGAALILLDTVTNPAVGQANFCQWAGIENITFVTTSAAAVEPAVTTCINCTFKNIVLDAVDGLILDAYFQKTLVQDIYSVGNINRMLVIVGNDNVIQRIDKEGGTGTSTDPYVLVSGSGNVLRNILLEGSGHVNKTPLRLQDCGRVSIEGYWNETTTNNGHVIEMVDCDFVEVWGYFRYLKTDRKAYIRNVRQVYFARLSTNTDDVPWQECFDVDSVSALSIDYLESRRGANTIQLGRPLWRIGAHSATARAFDADPNAGLPSLTSHVMLAQGNLLQNPSFEAGVYGWTLSGTATPSVVASEVGSGLMLSYTWATGNPISLTQTFTVTADMIGRELVFSAKVRHESATSTSRVQAQASGAGIVSGGTSGLEFEYVTQGAGWHLIKITIIPSAAGTLTVGVYSYANTPGTVYVDDAHLGFGHVAGGPMGKFASLDVGGRTVVYASAAPTTGTWKAGDLAINNAGTAPFAWKCTVAGTPGTWVALWTINSDLATYADEAAAVTGGIATGTPYKTATGELRIKL